MDIFTIALIVAPITMLILFIVILWIRIVTWNEVNRKVTINENKIITPEVVGENNVDSIRLKTRGMGRIVKFFPWPMGIFTNLNSADIIFKKNEIMYTIFTGKNSIRKEDVKEVSYLNILFSKDIIINSKKLKMNIIANIINKGALVKTLKFLDKNKYPLSAKALRLIKAD
ncbi:MAG: hypothetical protein ACI83O_000728 [Patescibacteria group bacterium]|jgi:hypothetical protein